MLGTIVGTIYGAQEMPVVMHGFGEVMCTPSKRYTSDPNQLLQKKST